MKSTFQKSRSFTLVELLTVMVIVGILFGLVLAPYEKLVMGTGVDAATFQLNSGLRLARQKAISSRRRVAVLLPDDAGTTPDSLKHQAFAYAYVNLNGTFEEPVENTSVKFLSKGAVINDGTINDSSGSPLDYACPGSVTNVVWSKFSNEYGSTGACRAIVFKQTGELSSSSGSPELTIVEGFVSGTNTQARNSDNYIKIEINSFTGRSKTN